MAMQYVSTRGEAKSLEFADVLLEGLASDGGLYVPASWPQFTAEQVASWRDADYATVAKHVMRPFIEGSIDLDDFNQIVDEVYAKPRSGGAPTPFMHQGIAPLKQLDEKVWFLELFHGPTLAFKDYALQLVGRMFDYVLNKRGKRLTIVGATSGDTGSAAIAAVAGLPAVDIFILHPKGRVSPIQQRQMTSVMDSNVFNIAMTGTFDDCQDRVKDMFNDAEFRHEVSLGAVNSINWCRVMAQIAYYAYAAAKLSAPGRPVDFAVPTGNYGNVLAAYAAKRMGLPIGKLGVGSNRNDILTRFLEDGDMSIQGVEPSLAPSMDIQVSSNFERYLFEVMDRDGKALAGVMKDFRASGTMTLGQGVLAACQNDFFGYRLDDAGILAETKRLLDETGGLIDPHSVVAVSQAQKDQRFENPVVAVGTAHPAKFPAAVEQATGVYPALPAFLSDLMDRDERLVDMPNDLAALQDYVRQHRSQ